MARLDEIIKTINTNLSEVLGIQDLKGYGIATFAAKGDQQIPYVMTDKDFEEPVTLDDSYEAMYFHKLTSTNQENDYTKGFGRNYLVTKSYELSHIFYFRNQHQNTSVNFIGELINGSLPVILSYSQRNDLKIKAFKMNVTGQDINKEDIYRREFPNLNSKLDTQSILVRTDYKIEIKYLQSCTDLGFCISRTGIPTCTHIYVEDGYVECDYVE